MNSLKDCDIFENFDNEFTDTIERACVFFKNEAFVVDRVDNVYHLVNNRKKKIDILCNKGIEEFTYAYFGGSHNYHMMARTRYGKVYSWGRNTYDQIKKGPEIEFYIPQRMKFYSGSFDRMRLYFAESFYQFSETFILNTWKLSSLWTGLGHFVEPRRKFMMIACGATHCLAVTAEDTIMTWGGNQFGQIGNGKVSDTENPFEIFVEYVEYKEYMPLDGGQLRKCCSLITAATLCLSFCPIYLFCLPCMSCCMCCNCNVQRIYITEDSPIKTVACGTFHNLVLFENGTLWGWGDNQYGQLGRLPMGCVIKPIPIFENVKAIATFNSHTLILCRDNYLYGMGSNSFGQLGEFLKEGSIREPVKFNLKFTEIATIGSICVGKVLDGQYFAWGLYKLQRFRRVENDKEDKRQQDKKEDDSKSEEEKLVEMLEEKNEKTKVIKDIIRAYIIAEPKAVRCNSLSEFFVKCSSLTYFTEIAQQVHKEVDHREEFLVNLKEELIDEKELKVIEFFDREDTNKSTTNNYSIGDQNKFSILGDGSSLNTPGDVRIDNVKMCGKKSAYQSLRNLV